MSRVRSTDAIFPVTISIPVCLDSSRFLVLWRRQRGRPVGSSSICRLQCTFLSQGNELSSHFIYSPSVCPFSLYQIFFHSGCLVSSLYDRTPWLSTEGSSHTRLCYISLYQLASRLFFYYGRESVRNYYERYSVSFFLKSVTKKMIISF